jgi:nucleoside-diphosphate-sugar epimerase
MHFAPETRHKVHGDGRQSRRFAFIADVVQANLLAATAPAERCAGRAYNIGGDRSYELLEMLAILEEVLGVSANPTFTPPRAGDIRNSSADLSARPS